MTIPVYFTLSHTRWHAICAASIVFMLQPSALLNDLYSGGALSVSTQLLLSMSCVVVDLVMVLST